MDLRDVVRSWRLMARNCSGTSEIGTVQFPGEKEAVALRQACAAVLERSYIRNQNTAELFIGHSDNIDDAEA
ncbi:hypothetical protein DY000_02032878 [Brassica cretica]|uniref:Uncharacterized protein n=1 Tax=Brassica cretica TaxID=69181 RepID=A0ABQ7DQ78_BRACR|nr:hypothetical protein DY000_02032878 [Brassica cretica]